MLIVVGQLFTSIPLLQTQYLPTRPTTTTTIPIQLFDEYALQLYMHERRLSLLVSPNDTHNPIFNYLQIYDHFRKDMEFTVLEDMQCKLLNSTARTEYLKIYTDAHRGDILSGKFWDTVCCGAYGFFATNGTKKHISLHPFDSNWGEFSEYIPNRSTNWGGVNECYDEERKENLLWRYLNHTNLSAVFTVQVRYYILEKVKSFVSSCQKCVDYFLLSSRSCTHTSFIFCFLYPDAVF